MSEPDFEVDLSQNCDMAFIDQALARKPEIDLVMPAIGTRIKVKSEIELSDRQQLALENAVEQLTVLEPVSHDLLHFHAHRDCP